MSHLLKQILVEGLMAVGFLSAMLMATHKPFDVDLNNDIISALLAVLFDHDIDPKDAMGRLGYDKSQWSRICTSELPAPSITRLSEGLPWPVLSAFIVEWSKVVATYKLAGVAEAVSLRRNA